MGTTNQQYCLRWNNHRSNLLLVFEHLFHTEAFTDVTLACDGNSIKCHKMVLAACSSYFQQLFLDNDCRHPIVILKDILFSEVKAILEYMYKGEVNVGQDQLSGLLKAAETLKVKGLVEDHQRASAVGSTSPHSYTPFSGQHQLHNYGVRPPAPVTLPSVAPAPVSLPPVVPAPISLPPVARSPVSLPSVVPAQVSLPPVAPAPTPQLRESPDTYFDDSIRSVESDKMYEDNHSFSLDSEDNKQGMGGYAGGSNQKPEWKRYKQYTRNDICAAIEAVRAGMSALQAARKYGVPSRTLYDKVKKLGITTNRPYRKGSCPMSPYQGLNLKMEDVSGYSPEEPLDVSSTGNGYGNSHGQEGDSDKIDSDPGSSSIKQDHSPTIEDLEESPHYERMEENNSENDGKRRAEMTSPGSGLGPPRRQPPPPPFPTYLNGSYFGA